MLLNLELFKKNHEMKAHDFLKRDERQNFSSCFWRSVRSFLKKTLINIANTTEGGMFAKKSHR